ncbi:MAG TPA: lytic murein transglycosylase B [Steroidobacteraceae bacterium]|nr:lytic murein transglycosylase B [Steroidobacteraceae bacterium]
MRPIAVLLAAAALAAPLAAGALDTSREDVAAFIAEVASRDGFDAAELGRVLSQAESRRTVLEAAERPAEKTLSWPDYRARFLTEQRIGRGSAVYAAQSEALGRASASGVPAPILLGIVGVETFYGERTGKHRVIDALATLAFDFPARGDFFRGELEQFLLMAREEGLDPLAPLGSYAGAMGIPQFMPSSFRAFAVDGDGDQHRDLWTSWPDVFASVANYLAQHGWKPGEPVMAAADATGADLTGLDTAKPSLTETVDSLRRRGVRFETTLPPDAPAMLLALPTASGAEYRVGFANFYALTRYNRSPLYASAVHDLAEAIEAARQRSLPPEEPTSGAAAASVATFLPPTTSR